MAKKISFSEYRACNARWLNQNEAAYYLNVGIDKFNKSFRHQINEITDGKIVRFDSHELDLLMESKKIGNLSL